MKDFELEYDVKARAFSVNHTNILKQDAKDYEKALEIKPFQISVQVAFDKEVRVANPDAVEQEMQEVADKLEEEVHQEIRDLDEKIQKLKKEEDAGNKTAAVEAEKIVKLSKKKLEKLAGEFGMKVRIVVEKMLTDQNRGAKVKCRSASRTVVRGLELNEEFFDQKGKSEQSDPYFGKLATALAASGKEIAKLTLEEKNLRKDLSVEIVRIHKIVEAARGNKKDFDIKAFAKSNTADARKLESLAIKYFEFVTALDEKLEALRKSLTNFEKLVKGAESLDDQKQIEKHVKEYDDALATVKGTIEEKLDAGRCAQHLLKDDYKTGEAWPDLAAFLDSRKAAANSGNRLQEHGAALAKLAKK
jgi:hypothetical protein